MNDFGVIELAGAKTTSAPGWAYVPDTRLAAATTSGTTTTTTANRKRARNAPGGGLTLSDLTARQENKMRKELEALDRDGGRDTTIPLPGKSGRSMYTDAPKLVTSLSKSFVLFPFPIFANGYDCVKTAQRKHTANVRKIMQSQKTFANHLDDFLALQALTESNAAAVSKRSSAAAAAAAASRSKDASSATPGIGGDSPMPDAAGEGSSSSNNEPSTMLAAPHRPPPLAHPGDVDPLLMSRVPPLPTEAEMRRLLAAPPLSYGEARGNWTATYPVRVFCEVCGYWGRVRCLKCGTRVCALECLETHREECVTRYGI
ncbi:hypothetical protein CRV24_009624 [Beauveria bassiana]|uniref:HIT zinc finger protein n=1 Tax=Beauveria bassiana (strain ARSEF 2860) TaxID=655819 RepID=J4KLY4_BEAB2|nr:HIT zinc finger protein [Beauveria bassiana ARSEF 2860]EJP63009.1 HIT zinc finger protein [Beauveria bassiana ARSEF 2860]KAF1730168.1 hypothetical protein CRV24_009624 [Beauveria bassiana]